MRGFAYKKGAGAYADIGVESGVMSASPHRLIEMLFDAALLSIRGARLHMRGGNDAEKNKAITKAVDIVNQGLLAALDRERGGELANNLARLYDYAGRLLLQANVRNDESKLDEAQALLENIGSAWKEIGAGDKDKDEMS